MDGIGDRRWRRGLLMFVLVLLAVCANGVDARADEPHDVGPTTSGTADAPDAAEDADGVGVRARYDKGLDVVSADGNWRFHLELRGQFRLSYPFDALLWAAESQTAVGVEVDELNA